MTAPSTRLREAAARLREAAAKATPGPWRNRGYDDHPGDEGWWVLGGGVAGSSAEHAVVVTFALNRNAEGDADWIAFTSPALAEHWAVLLEAHAPMFEIGPKDATEEERLRRAGAAARAALALADVVLGGAS